jgi:hypothetical protein
MAEWEAWERDQPPPGETVEEQLARLIAEIPRQKAQLQAGLKELPQPSSEPLPAVEPDPSEVIDVEAEE